MQIVVLTDFGTKNIENLWECKQAEKRQVFWAGTAQQVPRLRRRRHFLYSRAYTQIAGYGTDGTRCIVMPG